jgi:hypothetical protein
MVAHSNIIHLTNTVDSHVCIMFSKDKLFSQASIYSKSTTRDLCFRYGLLWGSSRVGEGQASFFIAKSDPRDVKYPTTCLEFLLLTSLQILDH